MRLLHWLFRWALHLSIGCVLLDTAMPVVAVAVAHARGVPITHLCHLYGVVLPGQPVGLHHDAGSSLDRAHAAPRAAPESHGEGSAHGDHDECPLRCLVAQALPDLPDLRAVPKAPASGNARVPQGSPRHSPRDAVARWVSALAQAPPQRG